MTTLYLAWRQPDRRWWPVGRLTREGGAYIFSYIQGALRAEAAGFRPLLSFPDRDEVYVSSELFPLFANRVPPRSRPDYDDYVQWLDVASGERDPMVLLARSGGRRETDLFEVFPAPQPTADGRYETTFFLHGMRYRPEAAQQHALVLNPGDRLLLEREPQNPEDRLAVRVLAEQEIHLGFVPRYLAPDIRKLMERVEVTAAVRRVNPPPTPMQFRVLCSVTAPWPADFRALDHPDFEPLRVLAQAAMA